MKRLTLCMAAGALVAGSSLAAQAPAPRSLSLEEALQLARPASEGIALARLGVDQARGQQYLARSPLLPQLSGSIGYTHQLKSQFDGVFGSTPVDSTAPPPTTSCPPYNPDPSLPIADRIDALEQAVDCSTRLNPFAGFSRLPFGRKNTYTWGLSASQTLFDGGRAFGQIRAANAGRTSATIGLTSAEAAVVLEVVQAYYDAALTDRLVAIAEATLAQTDTTLRQTQLRREVGTVPEFDLLRARVARDNQRPAVIQAHTARDLAYVRLRQLLNLPADADLELTTALADTSLIRTPTLAQLAATAPDTAVERRAPVRQAALAVAAQEGLDQASRAGRLPSVSLTSQYTRLAYPTKGLPGLDEFVTDWNLALGVQIPIFTGGRIKGDRIRASAAVAEAKLRLTQAREAAELDARSALAQLDAAIANWQASEGTAAQATRAYQIAEIRFQEGISTQTELLDARIALQQAEVNQAQAARDLQIARARASLIADLPFGATSSTSTAGRSPSPASN
ncbi:MAG: TolC family protein [Gemmatimonadales bacterium]